MSATSVTDHGGMYCTCGGERREELVHLPTSRVVHLKVLGHPISPCGAGSAYQGGWVRTSASEVTVSQRLRMCTLCTRYKSAWRRRRGVR